MAGVEDLVGPHDGHQVFRFGEIDDIVGVARQHMDGLDAIAGDLELHDLVRADLPLLDEAVTGDNDKELLLAVVPVLALGDAGLADIHGELAVVGGLQQLRKAAALVAVHLQVEGDLILGQIGKIHGIQLLFKAAVGDGRHDQGLGLIMEGVQQLHDAAQGGFVSHRRIAVTTVICGSRS